MTWLKPWHTLILGLAVGFAIARKTNIKVPVLG